MQIRTVIIVSAVALCGLEESRRKCEEQRINCYSGWATHAGDIQKEELLWGRFCIPEQIFQHCPSGRSSFDLVHHRGTIITTRAKGGPCAVELARANYSCCGVRSFSRVLRLWHAVLETLGPTSAACCKGALICFCYFIYLKKMLL